MMDFPRRHFILTLVTIFVVVLVCIGAYIHIRRIKSPALAMERIKARGQLRVITNPSIDSYYRYQDESMGFEYDLAKEFAKWLKVDLKVMIPGRGKMFSWLKRGKGDMIAAGIPITPEKFDGYLFSVPYMTITQRIVHHSLDFSPITTQEMAGKTFHLIAHSSAKDLLIGLQQQGIKVNYVIHKTISQNELLSMVNSRAIAYTITSSNVAMLSRRYYPDIAVGMSLGKKQSLAWAIQKKDTSLLMEMNRFLIQAHKSGLLKRIKNKYYYNIDKIDIFDIKQFKKRLETRFPEYKKLIQKESEKYGFDWRMITALIYQESHFDPKARSKTNVRGLMQVTMSTAREMGITNRNKPKQSIRAGIKYLRKMYDKFEYIQDDYQRIIFALASYNVGYGHVLDAMDIAKKKGYNNTHWQGLKKTLPLLAKSAYHTKTRYGYARGWEPVQYVDRILTYYDILRHQEAKSTFQQ